MFYLWNERGMNNLKEIYEYVKGLSKGEKQILEAFVEMSSQLKPNTPT